MAIRIIDAGMIGEPIFDLHVVQLAYKTVHIVQYVHMTYIS